MSDAVQDFWALVLGPQLVGTLLNTWLFGIVLVQGYDYVTSQSVLKDRLVIRAVVVLVLILEIVHTTLTIFTAYSVFVVTWGNYADLIGTIWSFEVSSVVTSLIGITVQQFFAWRIKVLTGQTWVVVLIVLFAYISLGGSILFSVKLAAEGQWLTLLKFKSIILTGFIASLICDFIITVSLVWFLRAHKRGFGTDGLISRIITYTVQTNALTFIWIAWIIICFLKFPTTLLDTAFYFPAAKISSISLLSSLNRRATWLEPSSLSTLTSAPRRSASAEESFGFASFPSRFDVSRSAATFDSNNSIELKHQHMPRPVATVDNDDVIDIKHHPMQPRPATADDSSSIEMKYRRESDATSAI